MSEPVNDQLFNELFRKICLPITKYHSHGRFLLCL